MQRFDARVIGAGRAGSAIASALTVAGWSVDGPLGRDFDPMSVANGARILVLAVPDDAVAEVAASIDLGEATVLHVAGSLGLDVLTPHTRVGSVHPLVALPDAELGAMRLRGAWFAVSGDEDATTSVVDAVGGRTVPVADSDRVAYHAAAVIAANHVVALLGQVDRVARSIGVPLDAYLDLARGAIDNVAAVGAQDALTGPVARDDWATVARHLDALPAEERAAYSVLADAARRLRDEVPA